MEVLKRTLAERASEKNFKKKALKNFKAFQLGVVACTYNPATLKAEFQNGVGSIPVGGNNPSKDGWIVCV